VCSKNELATVETALARKDIFLDRASLFPVCAGWGPKSTSVGQILRAWNIGEDAVVFVDDNPMELAEVQRMYPALTCRQFRGKSPAHVWNLLGELRDLFGKPVLTEEDSLRQASIRASAQIQELGENTVTPEFLRSLEGTLTVSWRVETTDKRPLDLINKTNQFNLNGLRIDEGEWLRSLDDPNTILAVISYRDKFGPLGKIAVAAGSQIGGKVKISHWVMSCRAFSRRIEHHTLDCLFRRSAAEEIEFAFQVTERNQPLQNFFETIGVRPGPDGSLGIRRAAFLSQCGCLPHHISEVEQ
jgi:FkbH-like protein